MHWTTARFTLDLNEPRVMGIVNLTPDSFSDGGAWGDARAAIHHAERLVREGAEVLDLGAESSRPGAPRVDVDAEWGRLAPVLREVVRMGLPISVDTCKPAVMRRALDAGADAINDIQALQAPGALEAVAAHPQVGVCLMHMRGDPGNMQQLTAYEDVVGEVHAALRQAAQRAQTAGVAGDRIVLDPGFGFAKTPPQNLTLHAALPRLLSLGFPVLAGWSRKSTLGWVTGRPVHERLAASVAASLSAAVAGARLLRVHDVAATVDALRVWRAAGQWPHQVTTGNIDT